MRKYILLPIVLFLFQTAFSQDLTAINEARVKKTKGSLIALGSWSAVNIAGGLALRGEAGTESYNFHTMNAGWNAINLGIAALGYWAVNREDYSEYGLKETLKKQRELEISYLVNGALDLAYMAGGAYLIERSKNEPENAAQFAGFGKSIILQGGFLLVLDAVSYIIHIPERKQLDSVLDRVEVVGTGLVIRF